MIDIEGAKTIVLFNLGKETKITGAIEYNGEYLFIAIRPDPLEGHFDPFVKVNKKTGAFIDFSPQDYENPLEIINLLTGGVRDGSR